MFIDSRNDMRIKVSQKKKEERMVNFVNVNEMRCQRAISSLWREEQFLFATPYRHDSHNSSHHDISNF